MTFSKVLAETVKNGKEIRAYESIDKYETVPYYEIVICSVGNPFAESVVKTARTTWKRKYKEICETI